MNSIPNLTMADGHTLPQIGFGLWQVESGGAADVVRGALQAGYRLLDGAYKYMNEEAMGEGLRASGIPRDDVFVTTKVWNNEHGKTAARASVERSLRQIGVEQLNLCLIHWPVPTQDLYVETWEALVAMRDEGLIASIGVSNFNEDHLDRLIAETGENPAVNQIEVHPQLQQPQMRAANAQRGIVTQAWTPLGNGASFEAPPVADVANRTGKSPAQVILRWHFQLGHAFLPRSSNPERQIQNLDIFDFELTDAEMQKMKTLDLGMRTGPDPSVFKMM
ncbi:aldo/keto reductase [Marinovum sp. 2_MG-2023]|uniref:2,5-diketo-D-gluconate reductase A n=1 Tax=Primorskyibacter sedentarius TaxID=745311 RepID=A0A4R3J515_9RHOB|nr:MULTISPECIES: aldo/keto reductase [Roseobacteraceae]MDO6732168.1 aldo/keto reductase [Marinovum sp. 2_MG-2023]MDO6781485.1 aldo/keto reductase [Marinovum sp. 1_MG-2023]TCS59006.1 2,5-diketo-D-gluconate reductase A [Primorskyibacter sedentarius]